MRSVILAIALLGAVGRAASAQPMIVVVRVAGDADGALLQRVRGQTSDLSITLAPVQGPIEGGLAEQVAAARALAGERAARVVVWFDVRRGELLVHVAEPQTGRVLVRRLNGSHGEDSARLEAAAQVVRSAVRALAAGGSIGVADRAAIAAAEAEEPPPEIVVSPRRIILGRVAARLAWVWRASVGWQSALDGESTQGAHALAGRLAVERGRVAFAVGAAAGLPSRLDDGRSQVDVTRHALGLATSFALHRSASARVSAGVAVAVAAYYRSTVVVDPSLVATPARTTAAFLAGPEVRLAWLPAIGRGALALELTLGADLVAGAPELVYETGDGVEIRNEFWPVQPRAGLALVVRTRD